MNALYSLCVHRPHPPRLDDACAVTGLCAERGVVGLQVSTHQRFHGAAAHRAGHHGRAEDPVRVPPSPTASRRAPSPGCGLSVAAMCGVQVSKQQRSHGDAANRAGLPDCADVPVRVPPSPPCLDGCAVTGLWAERGGGEECRWLSDNGFTGTLPTELGTLTAVTRLCVHRPHPPRLDTCAVTGLWVEGAQGGGRWESPDGGAPCSGTRRLNRSGGHL
jgi:hypothetical protein